MAAVMQKAIRIDEDTFHAQQEYISRLEAENKGLRDLLLITNDHLGSHFTSKGSPHSTNSDTSSDQTVNECKDVQLEEETIT